MRKKFLLLIGVIGINCIVNPNTIRILADSKFVNNNMYCVYAQNQDVEYEYDSLGRVCTARYSDGTRITYEYDANGNLQQSKVFRELVPPDSEEQPGTERPGIERPGTEQPGTEQPKGESTEEKTDTKKPIQKPIQEPVVTPDTPRDTVTDIKNYNAFKKKKPVIKSLKKSKSKKKYYLKIQIKQMNKRGTYGEIGYQIKYANNKKFKKAKTVKVIRNKKGSITSKNWKVKKGKTYYVKVRAMMKTKTGKTIYSKYSKIKKLKVK